MSTPAPVGLEPRGLGAVPAPLLAAYQAARATPQGASLPGLSELLQEAMRRLLLEHGHLLPPGSFGGPLRRTAAATRARWGRESKKSTRDPPQGS